jgi:DNA-binding MarR family transcriptional regulator
MNTSEINERELRVIEEVGRDKNLTQRKISHSLGLSLGTTNLILKKLVRKGYIKTRQLNRRKIQYILTPKGFAEKVKKSYRYFLETIHSLRLMERKIQELVLTEYQKGKTCFIIFGDGELADIIELSLKDLNKSKLEYRRVSRLEDIDSHTAVILLTQTEPELRTLDLEPRTNRWIDVLASISGG